MRPYIDTHIHFWDAQHLHYPWLDTEPIINGRHDHQVLSEASAGLDLQQLVFVQADCTPEQGLDEVRWVTGLAREDPRITGIVAFAAVDRGEALRPYLNDLQAYPLVRGVRQLIQAEGPGFSIQPDFVRGVQMLPEYGLSFDICIQHPQFPDILQLVSACPEVNFILDHLGKPDIKNGLMDPWCADLERLAEFPNVAAKLSGMVTEADHQRWTPADLQPYIDHLVAAFGPDRIMFGGDWPVNQLATSYRNWFETAQTALQNLTEAQQDQIFHQNAIEYYKL
jgi:L-fuconolactonase